MRVWLILLAGGLVTFAMRGSFVLLGDRVRLPGFLERSLVYVAPAAFAAIAVPAVMGSDGIGSLAPPTPEVIAFVAAVAIIYRTKNMVAGLVLGMTTLWVCQWLGL